MRQLNITDERSETKITIQDLQKIEHIKECKLPKDYRNFLLRHNGGKPNFNITEIKDEVLPNGEANLFGIRLFYGISLDKNSSYDIFYNIKLRHNRIPDELLPIACNSSGDDMCICIRGNNYGKVYYWDHENEVNPGAAPWWGNIYWLADSFTELLQGLAKFDFDKEGNEVWEYQDGKIEVKAAVK